MNEESLHLQSLARALADAYVEDAGPRAILLTGSAATGDADRYSDLDLIVYHDVLPRKSLVKAVFPAATPGTASLCARVSWRWWSPAASSSS